MAKLFVCSLLFVLAASAGNVYAEVLKGATPIDISARPYTASILTFQGKRVCGGALINSKTVVTSASCVSFYDVSELVVGVNNGAQIGQIAASIKHPQYDPVTNENDIAVLKLVDPVVASFVAMADSEPSNGVSGVVIGWAANVGLSDLDVSILSAEKCGSGDYKYSKDEILDSMLCSVPKNSQGCGGIVGCPVIANDQLVGLLSWGYSCGNKGNPAVLTNVAKLQSWVLQAAKNL